MKIKICGIKSLEKRACLPFPPNTVLISIGDTGAKMPLLLNKPNEILRLQFDDITLGEAKEEFDLPKQLLDNDAKLADFLVEKGVSIFNSKQADTIADFVMKHKDTARLLICQCHYGQSRSAGCAAAVAEHFYGNGIDIFADDRYYPNKLVFRLVLNALKEKDLRLK